MNSEELKQFTDMYEILANAAWEHAKQLGKIDSKWKDADGLSLTATEAIFDWDEYWAYGGYEHHRESFPLTDLLNFDATV